MEFTVFTTAGGFREFPGDSTYRIGEENGVLFVTDGTSGQVIAYGASGWASIQEWQRNALVEPPAGERRAPAVPPPLERQPKRAPTHVVEAPVEPEPMPLVEVPGLSAPRPFDPLSAPLESFVE